jgi:hypothetical protein
MRPLNLSGAFSTGVTSLEKKLLLLLIRSNPVTMINNNDRSSNNRKFKYNLDKLIGDLRRISYPARSEVTCIDPSRPLSISTRSRREIPGPAQHMLQNPGKDKLQRSPPLTERVREITGRINFSLILLMDHRKMP